MQRSVCRFITGARPVDDDWKKRAVVAKEVGVHFNGPDNEHGAMDFRSALNNVICPTLVLAGDKDPITPISFGAAIAACLYPDVVRFERFPGCGHPVFIDDPVRAFEGSRSYWKQMPPKVGKMVCSRLCLLWRTCAPRFR